jgi:hypothetical protein
MQRVAESLGLGLFHSSGKQNATINNSLVHIQRVDSLMLVFVGRHQDLRMR